MPFINIQTIEGLLDKDSKAELFKRITDLFVEIEGKGNPAFGNMSGFELMNIHLSSGN